jgi:rhamnose transport system ATP-binding protein
MKSTIEKQPLVSLVNVTKAFPGVLALDNIQLNLYPGKVMALIGENGAGKSTAVKILTGLYKQDKGDFYMNGEKMDFDSPHDARTAGISAIHQETIMFDKLSVCENIFMGHQLKKSGSFLLDWKTMKRKTQILLDQLEVDFTPDTKLQNLSVAQKHIVEIAKALSYETELVIMDEPTAALSLNEIEDLYKIVNQLKKEGKAILFISHKFEEIFAIADYYTVYRDGQYIAEGEIKDIDSNNLIKLMVGRDLDQVFPKLEVAQGESILDVTGFTHPTEFDQISFSLKKGEILGFYGLVGAGRSEVAQAIFGISQPVSGEIKIAGETVTINSPKDAIKAGIAYVPEDRQLQGAVLNMDIKENITLPQLEQVNEGFILKSTKENAMADNYGQKLAIKAFNWSQKVSQLSGGNQQKVVLSKWLATDPKILILDEPTKGIDVGSKAAVHELMGQMVKDGLGVMLISSELPEILGMADNIIVMHEGMIKASFSKAEATSENIVAAATGSV